VSPPLPLVAHGDLRAPIAWRPAAGAARAASCIDVRTFLADVARLRALLPDNRHVLNVCTDRYRFMVGLAAAMCADKISLLPSTHTPESVRQMRAFAADVFCLADSDIAIDLPLLPYPEEESPAEERPADAGAPDTLIPTLPADRIVAYVFTSGSTGAPVPHAKRWGALVGSVQAAARRLQLHAADRCTLIGTVPPQHMYGFESTVLLALQGGAAIWSGKPFFAADIEAALAAVPAPRVLVSTPFHLHAFVAEQLACPPVQMVLSATAPLTPELARAIEERCAAPLLEIYGCTESGQIATRRPLAGADWQLLDSVRMTQEHGADSVSTLVEADFIDGSIPLGDIIELVDTHHFRLLGRSADLVNIVGKRTSLGFLNQQLLAIPGVRDGCFFLPDGESDGKANPAVVRLAAFAVADSLSAADILHALRERIDPVFLPRPLHLVAQLPRNAAGKLPRSALQALWQQLTGGATTGGVAAISAALEHVVTLRVDPQHPVFAGHFPGRPIVPGVLLIDWALAALQEQFPAAALPGELGTVKFLRPVLPGVELRIVATGTAHGFALRIECEGDLVASATLSVDADR
jgi:acyl-CoA synthetase (AMP-forming)/AMP-acid ligase II/3-hydroxymyristoyl/3-hydroxydecanoyl-(acyl carrier protein) dehydratase